MEVVEVGKKANRPIMKFFRRLLIGIVIFSLLIVLINVWVTTKYWNNIVSLESVPDNFGSAIVFGAGLKSRGVPGLILQDRVLKSIELYQNSKVVGVLLSGDNRSPAHNEVMAMNNLAVQEGLPQNIIILDHSGLSTYDTCYRAITEFGLTRVVLVTQKYHLHRAVYVCSELGLETLGVDATESYYDVKKYRFREYLAVVADWVKLLLQ